MAEAYASLGCALSEGGDDGGDLLEVLREARPLLSAMEVGAGFGEVGEGLGVLDGEGQMLQQLLVGGLGVEVAGESLIVESVGGHSDSVRLIVGSSGHL